MSRIFMAGDLLRAPFFGWVDTEDFSIFSLHPSEDPALVAESSDLIRDITAEVEAGQSVLQPDEDLPNNRTALLLTGR